MAEIEITSAGELRLAGDVVGLITWARPYIGSDVAGFYDDTGQGFDEFSDFLECEECDKKDDEIEELEKRLNASIKREAELCAKIEQSERAR